MYNLKHTHSAPLFETLVLNSGGGGGGRVKRKYKTLGSLAHLEHFKNSQKKICVSGLKYPNRRKKTWQGECQRRGHTCVGVGGCCEWALLFTDPDPLFKTNANPDQRHCWPVLGCKFLWKNKYIYICSCNKAVNFKFMECLHSLKHRDIFWDKAGHNTGWSGLPPPSPQTPTSKKRENG